jgi:hypothetical protein
MALDHSIPKGGDAMTEVQLLVPVLAEVLHWNRARITFLAHFILALVKVRTVNFAEIAVAFAGKAKVESKYKRIQRFFRGFPVAFPAISKLIVRMLPVRDVLWILTLDRTNWKLGKVNINLLLLGIAYRGIAFPIIWMTLSKAGNSNIQERIHLMERFLRIFGRDQIECLTADREFLGHPWFSYLLKKLIHFCIRIRENMLVSNVRGIPVHAKTLFRDLVPGEVRVLKGRRLVCGVQLFVVGLRLPDGAYLILVTDKEPEAAMETYAHRWEIETLFGCLKSRGFRFESTHLTKPDRINKLVALLTIAFCWCHLTGEWVHEQKPIPIKKHGRKAKSIFRVGLDHLREILLNISEKMQAFQEVILVFLKRLQGSQPLRI